MVPLTAFSRHAFSEKIKAVIVPQKYGNRFYA